MAVTSTPSVKDRLHRLHFSDQVLTSVCVHHPSLSSHRGPLLQACNLLLTTSSGSPAIDFHYLSPLAPLAARRQVPQVDLCCPLLHLPAYHTPAVSGTCKYHATWGSWLQVPDEKQMPKQASSPRPRTPTETPTHSPPHPTETSIHARTSSPPPPLPVRLPRGGQGCSSFMNGTGAS
ncbi:hypothetical protein Q5P01_019209 [Channa striata]|uniref:Uncharacterized protein n=1 Tax=Channa striata TaxID=64152 RepID=A0AA88S4L0_CHASR|nr:hypothetical protein Q5P01_019209 [Channa striata]